MTKMNYKDNKRYDLLRNKVLFSVKHSNM